MSEEMPYSVDLLGADKPLLLLDVDGVINDMEVLMHVRMLEPGERAAELERFEIDEVVSHGYRLAIPRYMAGLCQELADRAEIVWLTTWRSRANDEIAAHLGIGPFEAIDPDGHEVGLEWKVEEAGPLIDEALDEGRQVIWIEDFNDVLPDIDDVIYVDTGEHGVLRWSDLPVDALEKAPGVCPECGSTDVAEILYGMPAPHLRDAIGRGDIIVGGCDPGVDLPGWQCKTCGAGLEAV